MVFNSNIFDSTSSQASFNGGKAQGVEAPFYTQAFEAGNKEANLYLTLNPYGFDLFNIVRIDNSLPRETRAQGWDSNPEPTSLRAAGPMDQGPPCLCFFGIKPLKAEAPAKS
ncbi:hypothetical protein DSO57_1023451 [Entomophthora muscae]|uniref:Uncharacterized protein n=1 Tax=Entomophthora muscae TaxID=34485 RepID=A0ACC2RHL2_9FUNG|nr:hypothetical protein DSO57_1023451 [Entomophthora muscae]